MSHFVRLVSLRGENLVPEDGETCDPYIIISVGGKTFKTETVNKNCQNPSWKDLKNAGFGWDGVGTMPEVEFTALDYDTFSRDDFIGYARVQLHPSMLNKEIKVPLGPRNKEDEDLLKEYSTLGDLYFTFHYDTPATSAPVQDHSRSPSLSTQPPQSQFTPQKETSRDNPSMSPSSGQPCTVKLVSLHGENLVPEDGETCDPYICIAIGGKTFKTETVKKNCQNPSWKELKQTVFAWNGTSSLPEVEFTAFDSDTFSRDDFIGYARVQLHPSMLGREIQVPLGIRDKEDEDLLKEYSTLGNLWFTFARDGERIAGSATRSTALGATNTAPQSTSHLTAGKVKLTRIHTQGAVPRGINESKLYIVASAYLHVPVQFVSEIPEKPPIPGQHVEWKRIEGEFVWDGTSPLPVCDFMLKDSQRQGHSVLAAARVQLHASMIGTEAKVNLVPQGPEGVAFLNRNKYAEALYFSLGLIPLEPGHQRIAYTLPASIPPSPSGATISRHISQNEMQSPQVATSDQAIKITVHRAFGLSTLVRENAGDAFVVLQGRGSAGLNVTLGRTKMESCRVEDVEWNQYFSFPQIDSNIDSIWLVVCNIDVNGSSKQIAQCPVIRDVDKPGFANAQVIPLHATGGSAEIEVSWEVPEPPSSYPSYPPQDPYQQSISHDQSRNLLRRRRDVAQKSSSRKGRRATSTLFVTVLSVANIPMMCNPYARVRYLEHCVDNRDAAARQTTIAVWNFATSFPLDPLQTTHEVLIDVLSDDRVIGTARSVVSCDSAKQKSVVLPLIGGGTTACGDVTAIFHVVHGSKIDAIQADDAVVELCIASAQGLGKKKQASLLAPYVIVTITGNDSELEYTSPSVRGTANPMWYFNVPSIQLDAADVISVGIWNEDSFGFDNCLGQVRIDAVQFLEGSSPMELQLEDREGNLPVSDFGKVTIEWFVRSRSKSTASSSPHVVEVFIHEAANLARTANPAAVVRVSCDDQPGTELCTKVVPKASPKWDECLHLRLDGLRNRLRLTIWDGDSPKAEFIGEAFLDLSATSTTEKKTQRLPLRPRRDSNFYTHDVALLNQSPQGLGAIFVSVKAFTVQQYDAQMRERLKRRGASYTLLLQVSDSADVPGRAAYYVKVSAGNQEFHSQCETTSHPKFRKTFEFELQYDTEMVYINLMERGQGIGGDTVVGEVSFPVNPPERIGVDPVQAWVAVKGPKISLDHPAKLLLRWRATRKPREGQQESQGAAAASHESAVHTPHSVMRSRMTGLTYSDDPQVEQLRSELDTLRNEVERLRATPHAHAGSPSRLSGLPQYSVHVYAPQANRISRFTGDYHTSVADILNFAMREFGLRHSEQYAAVFRGMALPPTQTAQQYVPDGETVFILPRDSLFQVVDVPGSPPATASVSSPANSTAVGQSIIDRLRRYGPETGIATVVITATATISSPIGQSIAQRCLQRQGTGFMRGVQGNGSAVEVFLQGIPSRVADLVAELDQCAPGCIVEEVRGYIPILSPGFRIAQSAAEGTRMFELCMLLYQTDDAQSEGPQGWFYKAIEAESTSVGVRYIDERA